MLKVKKIRNLVEANKANLHYQRGDEAWRRGQLRSAFRHFLTAAQAGMTTAFRVIGQFYERGDGVRVDKNAALYWYRHAARCGEGSAANNIGCILRDRGRLGEALRWFKRAVKLGDADANLEIARIYLRKRNTQSARPYLQKTGRSPWATEQSKREAGLLLQKLTARKAKTVVLRKSRPIR